MRLASVLAAALLMSGCGVLIPEDDYASAPPTRKADAERDERLRAEAIAEAEQWLTEAERAELRRRSHAAAESSESYERRLREDRWRVEEQVFLKDWTRWYQLFLSDGYTEEEARFKADRIMRGR